VSQRAAGRAVDGLRPAEPDLRARRGEGVWEAGYALILPELGLIADALGSAGVASEWSYGVRPLRACTPPVT
jgi:hypothetical protein